MALTKAQRIDAITQCSALLDAMEWSDLDLALNEHGFTTWSDWEEPTRLDYLRRVLRAAKDPELEEVHTYLLTRGDVVAAGISPFKTDQVRLFLSHLTGHRAFVGGVERSLSAYGVDAFVAHDSIEISREWQQVIEGGLAECDAMIAFLHDGFKESAWCDQELGWVMGRKRPVMLLGFGNDPHGFAGKFQALKVPDLSERAVAQQIFEWVTKQKTLQPRVAESLSLAFRESGSYDRTRWLIPRLEAIPSFTDDQLTRIESAVTANSQVRDASHGYQPVTKWVQDFLFERRSTGTSGWDDDSPF